MKAALQPAPSLPQTLLDQLAPNQLPEAVSAWPLAPGWWALVATLLLFCAALLWAGYRWQLRAYRRRAKREVKRLAGTRSSPQDLARAYSALLKSICLNQLHLHHCARLSGEDWAQFLQSHCSRPLDHASLEALCHYADPMRQASPKALEALCITWIAKHHV